MSENCKPKYKNLNRIQSFSDQRYATLQLFQQMCQNDEWLKQKVEELSYLTPPYIRQRYGPININQSESYGFMQFDKSDESVIQFSDSLSYTPTINLLSGEGVDTDKTTARLYPKEVDGEPSAYYTLPLSAEEVETDLTTAHPDWGKNVNSFWYVGFDKNTPYFIKREWVDNPKSKDIPSVCRAQTFKCNSSGLLESVTLSLQNTGELSHSWSSPLYVQIWATKENSVTNKVWDSTKKTNVPKYIKDPSDGTYTGKQHYSKYTKTKNGKKITGYKKDNNGDYVKQITKVLFPSGKITKPLCEAVYNPEKTTPGEYAFVFDNPLQVKKGESYALVMFSPLSHPQHCPRIGGYGRNCTTHKYNGGDAFLSENNGTKWIRYGNNDTSAESYKFGKYTPQDFTFQCKINNYSQGYDTSNPAYVYLKPILCNPIESFHLSGSTIGEIKGTSSEENIFLTFEYSINGEDWHNINGFGTEIYFTEENPILLCVRVKLESNDSEKSPEVHSLNVHLKTKPAKEMYVRTNYYDAKLTPMLGANLWGKVYAPYELTPDDGDVSCNVEIIEKKITTEHFHIISINELDDYSDLIDIDTGKVILDDTLLSYEEEDDKCEYLVEHPEILTRLKKHNVYVKPYTLDEELCLLSFDSGELDDDGDPIMSGLKLTNHPAYPIQGCVFEPASGDGKINYGEWYDYTVDYDTDEIYFNQAILCEDGEYIDFFENLTEGALCVDYNHVFIGDLDYSEVGRRLNEETGLMEEGLVLDYFKESFIIDESNVENRRVGLRCTPSDPLREVILNPNTDDERVLYEDIDFSVDYINRELVFPIVDNDEEKSILTVNDTLNVVYTPNLEDTSIALGYRAKRTKLSNQCNIKPNYFEYKV